jgi:Fe2+/Zn2+ uptake regulation proteins
MHKSLRMTHQREIILNELRQGKIHPTADELYERIKKKLPRVSLATIYRNLEILSQVGLIKNLEISGRKKRFDGNPDEHSHVCCTQCQRIDNVTLAVPLLQAKSIEQQGYRITGCRIEFFGLCPECLHQRQNRHTKGASVMSCSSCTTAKLIDTQRQVLQAVADSLVACGCKEVAVTTGLESKQVSCQITALKNKGYVTSPVRCKYTITEQGKAALG